MNTKVINKKNSCTTRGFTLIELLAVIVVLAVVMLIAVNAVLPKLEQARKSAFAIEANGAIKSAQQYYMAQLLTGGTNTVSLNDGETACVTIGKLRTKGETALKNTYVGCVTIEKTDSVNFKYTVSMTNSNYYVSGVEEANADKVFSGAGGVTDACSCDKPLN